MMHRGGRALPEPHWAVALEGDPSWSVPHLAPREVEALRLYATGLPMKRVAQHMGVKIATAHEYLKRVRLRGSPPQGPIGCRFHGMPSRPIGLVGSPAYTCR